MDDGGFDAGFGGGFVFFIVEVIGFDIGGFTGLVEEPVTFFMAFLLAIIIAIILLPVVS